MRSDLYHENLLVFPSELGWISLRMRGEVVRQLSFGHASAAAAIQAIAPAKAASQEPSSRQREVVERLQRMPRVRQLIFPICRSIRTMRPSSKPAF